jgi:glyoxylase-like metal-dependent hydrolase (beta-lactamase superfamily II)
MDHLEDPDLSQTVELTPKIWWAGAVDKQTPFQCHPYLLDDGEEAVLFEPGSVHAFPTVLQKISRTIPLRKIRYIVLSHQDPDLAGSLPEWEKVLDKGVQVVTHSRTAVLLRHYGASLPYYLIDQKNWSLPLSSGRTLSFLFAPWCHCPGTFMTYDGASRTLFSGDIFGAITYLWTFRAGEHYEEAMRSFHEDYMASTVHLKHALSKLASLPIDRILPQHGSILDTNIPHYIQTLLTYRCGMDLLCGKEPPKGGLNISSEEIHLTAGRNSLPLFQADSGISGKGYRDVVAMVLERQMGVLGEENTLSVARGVPGLEVDDRGNVLGIREEDGDEILDQLLRGFEQRFGIWAVLNCRLMLHDLLREYRMVIPASLKKSVVNDAYLAN